MIFFKNYFDYIWKQKLWQENIPKIDVEQTKGDGRSYPYFPIRDLI
jgi:hypothetical protein